MTNTVTKQLETITPEVASKWLEENNGKNYRSMAYGTAKDYADLMRAGKWIEGHPDGIQFDWDGNLGNGQHRLRAVQLSGKTIRMYVERGHDPAHFLATDKGRRRNMADDMEFLGFEAETRMARDRAVACARRMILGLTTNRKDASQEEVHQVLIDHGTAIKDVVAALSGSKPYRAEVCAAFAKALFEFDQGRQKVLEEASRFRDRRFFGRDDPLNRLHEKLISGGGLPYVTYSLAVAAIRAVMEERTIRGLFETDRDFVAPWEEGYVTPSQRNRGRKGAQTTMARKSEDAVATALDVLATVQKAGASVVVDPEAGVRIVHANNSHKKLGPMINMTLKIPEVREALAMAVADQAKAARG